MYESFHPFEIPLDRAKALSFFITLCEARKIRLKKVLFVMNGFQVFFEDMKGDAILHDGSYGGGHLPICL